MMLNMITDKIPLAPQAIEHLPVVTDVPIPKPPDPMNKIDLGAFPEVIQISRPTIANHRYTLPLIFTDEENNELALMDKPSPHGLFEIMILQAGAKEKPAIDDLSDEKLDLFLGLAQQFDRFVNSKESINHFGIEGSLPRASFNYDPWTLDRPGIQPITRLHLHLYLIAQNTLQFIREHRQAYGAIPSVYTRRRLVDPLSFLGTSLVYDLHQHRIRLPNDSVLLQPDDSLTVKEGLPLGLNIYFPKGWYSLTEPSFRVYLRQLHKSLLEAADEVFIAFTGKPAVAPIGTRHELLNRHAIIEHLDRVRWLSEKSRLGLKEMASWLRPASTRLLQASVQRERWAIHHIILNGLAYTVSFMTDKPIQLGANPSAAWLNISVRLFTDVGGAGVFGCAGASSLFLDRGKDTFTDQQMILRWTFQEAFQQLAASTFSKYPLRWR
jgi:hypothetical protein